MLGRAITTAAILAPLFLSPVALGMPEVPTHLAEAKPAAQLGGCPAVSTVAEGFGRLLKEPWQQVSFDRHQQLWPLPANRLTSSGQGSITATSDDRVVGGTCLCCSQADFWLREPGSSPRLALRRASLVMTFGAYKDAVAAGQQLVAKLGLPPDAAEFGEPWTPGEGPQESHCFYKWRAPAGAMSGWISVAKETELWKTSFEVAVMAQSVPAQPFTLSSGRSIRLIGVEKERDPTPSLVVGYVSDCRYNQEDCLTNEIKDILPDFQLRAEQEGCKEISFRIFDDWGGMMYRHSCKQPDGAWSEDCRCTP